MKHHLRSSRLSTGRPLRFETLEARQLLAIDSWQNPVQPLDVNGDEFVSPLDALIIINALNEHGPGDLNEIFGAPSQYYYDVNGDGLLSPLDALAVINRLNGAQGGPQLQLALVNDTGQSGSDRITNDPTAAGTLTVPAGFDTVKSITASLNNAPNFDLSNHVQEDGSFEIDLGLLQTINGGAAIPDGVHTLRVRATDDLGLTGTITLSFTLDRVAQTPGAPQITAASLSGSLPDATNITTPGFTVAAEAGSLITLFANDEVVAEGVAGSVLAVDNALADGSYTLRAQIVDLAGNVSSLSAGTNLDIVTAAPQITLEMMPFTSDLTPDLRVWVNSGSYVDPGAQFIIDVDLNDDGTFDNPGELAHTVGTLRSQTGVLQQQTSLSTPLQRSDDGHYYINVRARVVDAVGNEGVSELHRMYVSTQVSTLLEDYINTDDGAYEWTLHSQFTVNNPPAMGGPYDVYVIDLKSQRWRNPEDFGEPTSNHPFAADQTLWHHYLTILVPNEVRNESAMLMISGGSYTQAPLTPADFSGSDSRIAILGQQASLLGSVAVYLPVVPRENTRFADETRTRTEDAIIAYSFDKFLNEPLGSESDWPLLLAMAKSAVKAMDATQEFFAEHRPDMHVEDFVVTGGSKRGWTTWLTAAADDRVRGIMPMVFDALNLGQSMVHHYGVYNDFSYAIQDYVEANVFERILTDRGRELGMVVDPYSYLHNGRFEIPKLIINSAGDEFFVTDSSQFYFDDLPGEHNYLLYIANSGHGLDYFNGVNSKAVQGLTTFHDAIVNDKPLPQFSWEQLDNGTLRVQTITPPAQVVLWQGTNPQARDFRDATTNVTWTSSTVNSSGGGVYVANIPAPPTGATAFFMELIYPSTFSVQGVPLPFRFTTSVVVTSNDAYHPWPFDMGSGGEIEAGMIDLSAAAMPASTPVEEALGELLDLELLAAAAALPTAGPAALADYGYELQSSLSISATTTELLAAAGAGLEPTAALRQTSLGSYSHQQLSDQLFADELDDLLGLFA